MTEKEEKKNPVFYTVDEVAAILKVESKTVREACRLGTLGAQKIFNQWRISQESLDEFMNVRR